MRKVVFHKAEEIDSVKENRLLLNNKSKAENMKRAFELMALAAMFKKGPIKEPQELGIVLKRKMNKE